MNGDTTKCNILCGPLLRYTYIDHSTSVWHGTLLVVVRGSETPSLSLGPGWVEGKPYRVFTEKDRTFWRFPIEVELTDADQEVQYKLESNGVGSVRCEHSFWVPSREESMRVLFHSCNGFSLGVQEKGVYTNLALWNDVLRTHKDRPFHVMIGGGDQVYSDGVRLHGPLKAWATNASPRSRARLNPTDHLKAELDDWYFMNYAEWYTSAPFADAAARIPAVQIFDDHDIIDGYGSYPDRFMQAPVFLEIGRVAWKYYMLFQHHTHFDGEDEEDSSWVLGKEKGPYIRQLSRSVCTNFGKRVVFYGLDCRVDRTIDRICYASTYDAMFQRLERDVNSETKHLILLLGVPIAYPRLVFLEKFLSSWMLAPLRWMNRLFGHFPGLFNKYDGQPELLDDLTDHWCAGNHKLERNDLVLRLQNFARRKGVRITILSGDVHLACVGRFFSKADLGIPQNKDFRYMVNVISSAITNAPPPTKVADFLAKRNKLHHFDRSTNENLMDMFERAPNNSQNRVNKATMPARNYCVLTEHPGLMTDQGTFDEYVERETHDLAPARHTKAVSQSPKEDGPLGKTNRQYALEVRIHAEINPKDEEGRTHAYGFSIPSLELEPGA